MDKTFKKITCDLCIYFEDAEKDPLEQLRSGLCRRRAPFVKVTPDDWCSEAVENEENKKMLSDLLSSSRPETWKSI
jgi:hypothetical protein